MAIFDNYIGLDPNYVPNNSKDPKYVSYIEVTDTLPRKLYNAKGEFIGYSWDFGGTPTLKLSIDHEYLVESDAIILNTSGDSPTSETALPLTSNATIGQRCYNTEDFKGWTCVSLDLATRKWEQDSILRIPSSGEKQVVFKNQEFKTLLINLSAEMVNFRFEPVFDKPEVALQGRQLNYTITPEMAKKLVPSTYYLIVTATADDNPRTIGKYPIVIN